MNLYDDKATPYKKKSSKRPPAKAKHKHDFQPCVFEFDFTKLDEAHGFVTEPKACVGSYCTVCGKVHKSLPGNGWMEWVPIRPGSQFGHYEYTENTKRELEPGTRTLPTFRLEDYWKQKYIEI